MKAVCGKGKSEPMRSVPTTVGNRPLIERTDMEKVRICRTFLEKRGFVVASSIITMAEVAAYLQCSVVQVKLLMQNVPDFPKPYDIGANRKSIESQNKKKSRRWRLDDIVVWLESTR